MYFVLQNSLLMSYNSKEEYERKLASFKDVICLIPENTVLLPSLEARFTIASNFYTFYTFVSCESYFNQILWSVNCDNVIYMFYGFWFSVVKTTKFVQNGLPLFLSACLVMSKPKASNLPIHPRMIPAIAQFLVQIKNFLSIRLGIINHE